VLNYFNHLSPLCWLGMPLFFLLPILCFSQAGVTSD
jgi:hypothetical protein